MYRIGIDFGGTNIKVGLVNDNHEVLKKVSAPTAWPRPMENIVDDMASLCKKAAEDAGVPFTDIGLIGVASPGIINSNTGMIEYYCGMNLRNFPLAEILSEKLNFKNIYAGNDANAAALGEALAGAARGAKTAVVITLGTGVGSGIIIDGKIYDGFNFAAGELGHMVIEKDGIPCSCGRRGCWEKYSSASALISMTKEEMEKSKDSVMWELCSHNISLVSGRTAFTAAKSGDKAGSKVVNTFISYLACGITNVINIFQPEVLCIGGGVSGEGDNLLKPLEEIVMREQYAKTTINKTKVVIATLGNDAGIVGASCLGLQ